MQHARARTLVVVCGQFRYPSLKKLNLEPEHKIKGEFKNKKILDLECLI